MALQWTTEEQTLSNIKRGVADGWRMNKQQLYVYGRKLLKARERLFPGELGSAFVEVVVRSADDGSQISWPGFAKDVETIRRLLQGGREWNREQWLARLPLLQKRRETYFYTVLGEAFIQTLKKKLGVCETARQLRIPFPNNKEQTVCDDTMRLEELASWLTEEDADKPFRYFAKLPDAAAVVLACLSLCFLFVWLYGKFEGNRNLYDIQKLKAVSASEQEVPAENASGTRKTTKEDQKERQSADGDDCEAPQTAGASQQKKRPRILSGYQEAAKEYPGLFGWLRIPDTPVDLPVMQPLKEKDFYLDHDFTGAASAEGALFTDPQNSRWPQDDNTVIYGHNMKNGHMFGMLDQYEDPAYFQAHREIHFDTIYETGIYEAVAVLKTRILNENEQGFRYYRFFQYDNREQFGQCADFVRANQLFDTGRSPRYGDRILMLSTCEYSQENGRLVIVAVKSGDAESCE